MDASIAMNYVPELRQGPPWLMEEMVAAEPSLVEPILQSTKQASRIADLVKQVAGRRSTVVVTGCGTSETAAMAVADLLAEALRRTGIEVPLVHARQALEASLDPWPSGVCLGISHDGSTRATMLALQAAREAGAKTALITARAKGRAAALADRVIETPLVDRSWCHTVGYLSPILAGAAIAAAIGGYEPDAAGLREAVTEAAALAAEPASLARALFGVDRMVIAAAGADRSPARELALKIEEGAWLPARMLELETLLHGHLAACDSKTGLVVVATNAESRLMTRTRQVMAAARAIGMRVGTIVSAEVDSAIGFPDASDRLVLPALFEAHGLLGRLAGAAIALQKLTLGLAALAGRNPDLIRRQEEPYRQAAQAAQGNW
jgi:glucosamine--fructose-6-phosphate aminotransferase (isomerizing)